MITRVALAAIGVVAAALFVTSIVGLLATGSVGREPTAAQILYGCAGMFASVLAIVAALVRSATLTQDPSEARAVEGRRGHSA